MAPSDECVFGCRAAQQRPAKCVSSISMAGKLTRTSHPRDPWSSASCSGWRNGSSVQATGPLSFIACEWLRPLHPPPLPHRLLLFGRDGMTRSGLFCTVNYMVERLKVEQEVDVFQSVKHSRMHRPQLIPSLVSLRLFTPSSNTTRFLCAPQLLSMSWSVPSSLHQTQYNWLHEMMVFVICGTPKSVA